MIKIAISDQKIRKLEKIANLKNISLNDLIIKDLDGLINYFEEEFNQMGLKL